MLYSQKISFIDELENLRNENIALKRAVESKSAAIGILRNELQECQKERDDFRNISVNHPASLQLIPNIKTVLVCPERNSAILGGSENTLAQLLSQSKEENKGLRFELSELKCRLHDAQSDLKILRNEKTRKVDSQQCRLSIASTSQLAQQERESLIQQLEELCSKCQIQETDLRCLLEEREELVKERDEIRHKWHRLNHVLNKILVPNTCSDVLSENGEKIKPRKKRRIVDLDAIIAENRYLQQRLKQVLEEKSLAVANATKYKTALERGRVRTNTNSNNTLGIADTLIMSPKQVAEFLKEHNIHMGEERDLKLLCVALLDSLNQKSRFIKTQKAANKMLIERVSNLEKHLSINSDNEHQKDTSTTPTMVPAEINLISSSLMEGYNPSVSTNEIKSENVDHILHEIQSELGEEKENDHYEETNIDKEESDEIVNDESNSNGGNSDSEEIVSLENLDRYISDLKEKRRKDGQKFSIKKDTKKSDDPKDTYEDGEGLKSEVNLPDNLDSIQKIKTINLCDENDDSSPIKAREDVLSRTPTLNEDTKLQNSIEEDQMTVYKNAIGSPVSSSSSTFDIDISDYESDDDTFEQTLCNWQAECEKTASSRQTLIAKLSPKKSKTSMSNILKTRKMDLPEKLKEILN